MHLYYIIVTQTKLSFIFTFISVIKNFVLSLLLFCDKNFKILSSSLKMSILSLSLVIYCASVFLQISYFWLRVFCSLVMLYLDCLCLSLSFLLCLHVHIGTEIGKLQLSFLWQPRYHFSPLVLEPDNDPRTPLGPFRFSPLFCLLSSEWIWQVFKLLILSFI